MDFLYITPKSLKEHSASNLNSKLWMELCEMYVYHNIVDNYVCGGGGGLSKSILLYSHPLSLSLSIYIYI